MVVDGSARKRMFGDGVIVGNSIRMDGLAFSISSVGNYVNSIG